MYDGDTDAQAGDHPRAVSAANFTELYYRPAKQLTTAGTVPLDILYAGSIAMQRHHRTWSPEPCARVRILLGSFPMTCQNGI